MKKLLKQYNLNSDMQYYEIIAESFINGQRTQAIDQFKALPKDNKVAMLVAATVGDWNSGMDNTHITSLLYAL